MLALSRLVERRGTWGTWYPWYKGPKAQIFGKTWYKGLKSWLYQVFCTKLGTYRFKNRYFHRVKPYIGPKLGTKLYHIWYFDVPTLVPRKILQKKLGTRFSLVQISRVKTWYKKLFYKPVFRGQFWIQQYFRMFLLLLSFRTFWLFKSTKGIPINYCRYFNRQYFR